MRGQDSKQDGVEMQLPGGDISWWTTSVYIVCIVDGRFALQVDYILTIVK